MKLMEQYKKLVVLILIILLAACSGGGGGDGEVVGTGEKPTTIVGTAATGSPISMAPISAKSRNGKKISTVTGNNGKYSFTIPSTGSVLFKVDTGKGKTLYSIAGDSGTTNIHPFTDLIIRNWFKVQGLDIDAEFASNTAFTNLPTAVEVNAIKATINSLIAQAFAQLNVPTNFDLMSSDFDANGQGFDLFLDLSLVVLVNNTFNISITDPVTSIQNAIATNVSLNTNLTQPDLIPPSTPANIRAVPANATDIIVVWDPSSDNIGVAGYNVYRNGTLIATTPYPVFSDTGLATNTDYCYAVEAFDGAGKKSSQVTTVPCVQTIGSVDTTPPDVPTAVAAVTQGVDSIALTWTQTGVNDVVGFKIYRGSAGNVNTLIATVTSTAYTDFNLLSSTEYCYQVLAYDAAGNASAVSTPEACATTDIGTTPPPGSSSIAFSSANYQVTETGAVAVITVQRTGDNTTSATVQYATTGGTATANTDYTPVNGTLVWGSLDSSPRTIYIPIQPDLVSDNNETVLLTLSNFTNANPGAVTNTTVTITDAPCPGVLNSNVTTPTIISQCTVVSGFINVSSLLTIDPGVTLLFQPSSTLYISSTGGLSAIGSVDKPILLTGVNKTPGSWSGVEFAFSNNVANALDYVTIEYGGASSTSANLNVTSSTNSPSLININHTVLRNGNGYGFSLDLGTLVAVNGFNNLIVTGNANYPGYLPANLIHVLDPNSDYTGNGVANDKDQMSISNDSAINTAQTWPKLNVPYLMSSTFYTVSAALTIAPGVEMSFPNSGSLYINSTGSLSAIGTAQQPILFTSVNKTPGSWDGLEFAFSNNAANALDYVTVEYGGATATSTANVKVTATAVSPTILTATNSAFNYSGGFGILLSTAGAAVNADIGTANSFTGNISGTVGP